MRKAIVLSIMLIVPFALAACGGASAAPQGNDPAAAPPAAAGAIRADYEGALPVAAQLILGSLKLEDGDLAITVDEATKILPLWQAYQSLSGKETTAAAELDAVLRQIQNAMTPAQVAAIAGMQLTAEDITESMQAFGPAMGGGFRDRASGSAGDSGGMPAGGPPGGAMPLGGGPGGGPGGGFLGGAGGEQLSPEQRATAMAERMAENPELAANFLTRGILNQLITTLQLKTGDVTQEQLQAQQAQRAAMRWVPVVSEATGISVEVLGEAISGGKTLAEAIEAEGGDLTAAETALRDALKEAPNLDEQGIEAQIEAILNGAPPAPPQQ
jgi:hypothetical protein